MGISAVISFVSACWSGEDFDVALESACYSGLKVGGITWISSIAVSQIGRTGIEQSLRPFTDWVVRSMGAKMSATIANSLRSSSSIYGAAAMNNLSKLLRGNIVTGVITVGIMSSVDVVDMFRGRISGAQLFKNITNTAASVAGGTAGWMGGAAAGAAIGSAIPIIGNAAGAIIGGILGSLGGGTLAGSASSSLMDEFIKDDSKEMEEILECTFKELAQDYLLNQGEVNNILNELKTKLSDSFLRNMYAETHRSNFARDLMEPIIIDEVRKRRVILVSDLPSSKKLLGKVKQLLKSA